MFLCDKCHPKSCTCWSTVRSYGTCENCLKVRDCVDCHSTVRINAKKPKKAKRPKKPKRGNVNI